GAPIVGTRVLHSLSKRPRQRPSTQEASSRTESRGPDGGQSDDPVLRHQARRKMGLLGPLPGAPQSEDWEDRAVSDGEARFQGDRMRARRAAGLGDLAGLE